eukprot:Gregarina_sp_Poly_1__7955@NODE_454_length_8271_cov_214_627864_g368_i1_p2_GENE_NODE_454_length_8271_cov_214_627864_g368_i1NODE_454_length_8271_cov_214_627864_g368_i1_p2_ORF_typecomplete_len534_score86_22GDA1_CD39/PF01150_17/1_2e57_NODE_454_length_8271_cov_214_627864_g368_i165978198
MKFGKWLLLGLGTLCAGERGQSSIDPPPTPRSQGTAAPDFDYAIVLDVGSTGTRAHIHAYEWKPTECWGRGATHILMPGWSYKIKPGLAQLWQTHVEEGRAPRIERKLMLQNYLSDIRAFILDVLRPEDNKILFVRATGGFRTLSSEAQQQALEQMYEELRSWETINVKRSWIKVLSGDEEGAFSWLAINQLARRFFEPYEHVALHPLVKGVSDEDKSEGPLPGSWLKDNWKAEASGAAGRRVKKRVGMVEMGGASAQIALEPPRALRDELLEEMDPFDLRQKSPVLVPHPRGQGFHILHFCHENLVLQLQSLDGFGRQAALTKFLKWYGEMVNVPGGETFTVPCLPQDVRIPVSLSDEIIVSEEFANVTTGDAYIYAIGASGATANQCQQAIRKYIKKESLPAIPFALDPDYRIYATENFYYFNEYVAMSASKAANEKKVFSAAMFWNRAKDLCALDSSSDIQSKIHSDANPEKSQNACFGLVFLSEFLQTIVQVPDSQLMKAVTAVKDLETSFAVGSLLTELPLAVREGAS